jgi:hypothetical protein
MFEINGGHEIFAGGHPVHPPLLWAAKNGYLTLVSWLFQASGASVQQLVKGDGELVAWLAHPSCVHDLRWLLVEIKRRLNEIGSQRQVWASDLLVSASIGGRSTLVKALLDTKMSDTLGERDALWIAAINGHEAIVRHILHTGRVNVNFESRDRGRNSSPQTVSYQTLKLLRRIWLPFTCFCTSLRTDELPSMTKVTEKSKNSTAIHSSRLSSVGSAAAARGEVTAKNQEHTRAGFRQSSPIYLTTRCNNVVMVGRNQNKSLAKVSYLLDISCTTRPQADPQIASHQPPATTSLRSSTSWPSAPQYVFKSSFSHVIIPSAIALPLATSKASALFFSIGSSA